MAAMAACATVSSPRCASRVAARARRALSRHSVLSLRSFRPLDRLRAASRADDAQRTRARRETPERKTERHAAVCVQCVQHVHACLVSAACHPLSRCTVWYYAVAVLRPLPARGRVCVCVACACACACAWTCEAIRSRGGGGRIHGVAGNTSDTFRNSKNACTGRLPSSPFMEGSRAQEWWQPRRRFAARRSHLFLCGRGACV